MTIHDRVLLWRIRRNPAAAFDEVYSEYGQRVYRFCRRLCDNQSDAEDLAQEVFVAALGGLERFEGRSSVATWLYRIAVLRRGASAGRSVAAQQALTELAPIGSDDMAARLERMHLAAALGALPEAHRNAFLLVKAEGLTCREAADALDIPEGTVKYHVHSAVKALRGLLSTDHDLKTHLHSRRVPGALGAEAPFAPYSIEIDSRSLCHDLQ